MIDKTMMKSKLIKFLTLILLVGLISTCKKPEPETTGIIQGTITDETTGKPIPDVTISTIPITETPKTDANGKFLIENLQPQNYKVQASKSGYENKEQEINVIVGNNNCNFTLKLFTSSLTISSNIYTAPAIASTTNIIVTSNVDWTAISSEPSWLTCTPSGTGNSAIALTYLANTLGTTRTATVVVQGKNVNPQTVTFTQTAAAPNLTISLSNPNVSATAGSVIINVSSNIQWTAQSNQTWLTFLSASGNGNGTITANYLANNTINSRTVTVTVSGNGVTNQTIAITQAGEPIVLTAEPTNKEVTSIQGNFSINVTSNISWTAQSDQSWLTLTAASGSGNGTISANYTENISINSRSANITVSGNGATNQIVTVKQLGFVPNITFSFPNSTTKWLIGTTQTIQWNSNFTDNFKIDVYNGNNFVTTLSNSTNLNSITWNIPTTLQITDDYKIKITSTNYGNFESNIFSVINTTNTTVTDYEGNVYQTVQIGNQIWMKENLKSTKYNDGTIISNVTDNTVWFQLNTPAFCWYNNDYNTYGTVYGALYNWYVVDDVINSNKNVCPVGWYVPTDIEWTILFDYLGDYNGGKMKEIGTVHWINPNTDATNNSSFTALPAGTHDENGTFGYIGIFAFFLSTTDYNATEVRLPYLSYMSGFCGSQKTGKNFGGSIRCIKNTTKK